MPAERPATPPPIIIAVFSISPVFEQSKCTAPVPGRLKIRWKIGGKSDELYKRNGKQIACIFVNAFETSTMKYSSEILIRLPRNKVIEIFQNSDFLQKWQPGLKRFESLDGTPGEEGAQSKLVYESRKGDLVMTETIIKKQLPESIDKVYISQGVYNRVENRFTEQEFGVTIWQSVIYFRFRGIMMIMAPFLKRAFIQNTLLNMDRFKLYAENKNDTDN